jgi:acyl-CoA synthetase (NDP forming)
VAHPLDSFLNPASIAIVGASADPRRISGKPLRFLRELGYRGDVYPINPKYAEIQGWTCYSSLAELPAAPELVLVALAADAVLPTLEQAAAAGARAALLFAAGFAETGPEGAALQAQLTAFARSSGLRLIGPNCIGLVNLHNGVAPTFSSSLEDRAPLPGAVSFLTHSGAFGSFYVATAQQAGLGISSWINTGNEADLDLAACLDYYAQDPQTSVVSIYAEGLRNPDRFAEAACAARQSGKVVVMLKTARVPDGVRAATAHTACPPIDDSGFDRLCAETGVLRVDDLAGLLDASRACLSRKRPRGPRAALVGVSGGAGVYMADACARAGLQVAQLQPEQVERLRPLLPWYASPCNPVDTTAQLMNDPANFRRCLELLADDPGVDSLVVFFGLQANIAERISTAVVEVDRENDKPIFVTWMLAPPAVGEILDPAGVPRYDDPGRCIAGLAALTRASSAL